MTQGSYKIKLGPDYLVFGMIWPDGYLQLIYGDEVDLM
jgi:hypothetical protein